MTQAAFPASARLRASAEYKAVFARGNRYVCPGFVIIAAPAATSNARLGLAIAKRRVPRAVDRSRIKRVLRESFRVQRERLECRDIVVLARSHTAGMNNADLFAQLANAWPRAVGLSSRQRPESWPMGSGEQP